MHSLKILRARHYFGIILVMLSIGLGVMFPTYSFMQLLIHAFLLFVFAGGLLDLRVLERQES